MKTTFLGQGIESKSINAVGNHLMSLLNEPAFHTFVGISAFASKSAVLGFARQLEGVREKYKNISLIVGIDYEGTPKEALIEILNLNINSYVFYQSENNTIFHPKIYLFEGDQNVKLIVGSSNLTSRGLFLNVESSILIEFDIEDKEGMDFLNGLKFYYHSLFAFNDPNLFKLDRELIDYFVNEGIVPDETTSKKIYSKRTKSSEEVKVSSNASSISIPKRKTAQIPKSFQSIKRETNNNTSEIQQTIPTVSRVISNQSTQEDRVLLWKSGPLTTRDLNIPTGPNTNPTGSMLFKKGELTDIDQRHYFRDVVFSSLPWANDTVERHAHLQRATAFFRIIIQGKDYGEFPLILTHNTKTDTATYRQNNSMTQVSWGTAKAIIAKHELIGRSASLYKMPNSNNNQYTLEIE